MREESTLVRDLLQRWFDIRPGEYQRVLMMQANIFLIILTLLILKPVVNAQFLSVIGAEQLPLVFVLVAISAIAVSMVYVRLLNTRSLHRITTATLVISIVLMIAIAVLLQLGIARTYVLYIFYIGVAIFGVLSTSQFWVMVNLAFDAREAKRLLGVIGAAAIAGGITGGYLTTALVTVLDSTHLIYVAAAFLGICIPINTQVWKRHVTNLNKFQTTSRLKGFGDHPILLIKRSRHLTYLALIVGLSVLVAKLVEYQFSSLASDSIQDTDRLTAFFGFWMSTFNVISLVIQLFITRRVVGNLGVGSSLFILPGGLMLGSVLIFFAPVLWAGIFIKLWDISVKQSVNKAATELLALPIPVSIKSQTKSFVDVFVDMVATGLGGLMLIFLVKGLDMSVQGVSVLSIVMLGIWIWVATKVRKEYLLSFKVRLGRLEDKVEVQTQDFSDSSVIDGLRRVLEGGGEKQIIWVLQKVEEIPDKRLFDNVASLLQHPSSGIRGNALRCLYYLGHTVDTSVLESLIKDQEPEVRYQAFKQIMRQTVHNRISVLNAYLVHGEVRVSGAALIGLSEEARNNPELQRLFKLNSRLQDKIDYLAIIDDPEEELIYRKMILRAIGVGRLEKFYFFIEEALSDPEQPFIDEAIIAAGSSLNGDFVKPLAQLLVRKELRDNARSALLAFGPAIADVLADLAREGHLTHDATAMIPSVIERIDSQGAVNVLLELLNEPDARLRQEVLRSLNRIQESFPHLKIRQERVIELIMRETNFFKDILVVLYKMSHLPADEESDELHTAISKLILLLEQRLDRTLERIFRLLGLRYPPDDIIPIYGELRSTSRDVRINAVDFLDNLLEPRLKKLLVPIAETALLDTISQDVISKLKVEVPDEYWCFGRLLEGRDPNLKVAVCAVIERMSDRRFIPLIEPLLQSPVRKVREAASRTMSILDPSGTTG